MLAVNGFISWNHRIMECPELEGTCKECGDQLQLLWSWMVLPCWQMDSISSNTPLLECICEGHGAPHCWTLAAAVDVW